MNQRLRDSEPAGQEMLREANNRPESEVREQAHQHELSKLEDLRKLERDVLLGQAMEDMNNHRVDAERETREAVDEVKRQHEEKAEATKEENDGLIEERDEVIEKLRGEIIDKEKASIAMGKDHKIATIVMEKDHEKASDVMGKEHAMEILKLALAKQLSELAFQSQHDKEIADKALTVREAQLAGTKNLLEQKVRLEGEHTCLMRDTKIQCDAEMSRLNDIGSILIAEGLEIKAEKATQEHEQTRLKDGIRIFAQRIWNALHLERKNRLSEAYVSVPTF
jgi:hypothetical protein